MVQSLLRKYSFLLLIETACGNKKWFLVIFLCHGTGGKILTTVAWAITNFFSFILKAFWNSFFNINNILEKQETNINFIYPPPPVFISFLYVHHICSFELNMTPNFFSPKQTFSNHKNRAICTLLSKFVCRCDYY
jgi:hypothetical protein